MYVGIEATLRCAELFVYCADVRTFLIECIGCNGSIAYIQEFGEFFFYGENVSFYIFN